MRIVYATHGVRVYSGQSALSERQKAEEEDVMAVALGQPHRRGQVYVAAQPWRSTELGKFCVYHWNNEDTQETRYRAGESFAQLMDEEKLAWGFPTRQASKITDSCVPLTDKEMEERKKQARERLKDAQDAIRIVDNQTVRAIEILAWQDKAVPDKWHSRVVNGLYHLTVFFNPKMRSYHG